MRLRVEFGFSLGVGIVWLDDGGKTHWVLDQVILTPPRMHDRQSDLGTIRHVRDVCQADAHLGDDQAAGGQSNLVTTSEQTLHPEKIKKQVQYYDVLAMFGLRLPTSFSRVGGLSALRR